MEFLRGLVRLCLFGMVVLVAFLVWSEWPELGLLDLPVAWAIWVSPALRNSILLCLGLLFLDLILSSGRRR
jgi:hypothetical protein